MKKTMFVMFLLFFTLFTSYANAGQMSVDIINESHHVWGSINQQTFDKHFNSYATYQENYDTGDDFGWISSEVGELNVSVEAADSASSEVYAKSSYTFSANNNNISLNYSGLATDWDSISVGFAEISLIDLFSNTTLYTKYHDPYGASPPDFNFEDLLFEDSFSFFANSKHLYELSILTSAVATEGKNSANVAATLTTATVPEPPTITLITICAVAFIYFVRRKKDLIIS